MKMKIGLGQMNTREYKEENLAAAERLVSGLADEGAELVMLPEHFNFLGPDDRKRGQAETMEDAPSLDRMRGLAEKYGIHVHIGSFFEREGEKIYNTGVVFDPSGEMIAKYRKIHLFDVEIPGGKKYLESEIISAGMESVTFAIGEFVFGMATCYDLRFPELFRQLVKKGANVLLLPAAFTVETGRDHWQLLLRARAVENQCWVAAAGQWGQFMEGRESYGRSMVVDPWGVVVSQAPDGVNAIIAELDLKTVSSVRTSFPCLDHVRPDLYR